MLILYGFTVFVLPNLSFELGQEASLDIREEISKLRTNYDELYSTSEYNWKVWSKQFEGAGGILIEMESWDEFKEGLRQNVHVSLLMLDEENNVIWYRPSSTVVVYLNY
ncbi:MAG: hypothetical protein PVF15_07155 [Candidatus Bathyarchaeota archaeon]